MKKKVERKIERKVEQDLSLIRDTRVCTPWYVHSTNGFTCEEMIVAVQLNGCANECDDESKNTMIQRYNHGKFESLCRERTKKR